MKENSKHWITEAGIPLGLAVGAAVGYATDHLILGLSFGLMLGSTVALFAEPAEKRKGQRLMRAVALLVLVVTTLVTIWS